MAKQGGIGAHYFKKDYPGKKGNYICIFRNLRIL